MHTYALQLHEQRVSIRQLSRSDGCRLLSRPLEIFPVEVCASLRMEQRISDKRHENTSFKTERQALHVACARTHLPREELVITCQPNNMAPACPKHDVDG